MKEISGIILLLLTSVIWGCGFVSQRAGSASIPPFTFNALRFLLGSAVLVPFIIVSLIKHFKSHSYVKSLLVYSAAASVVLTFAQFTQQYAISYTTSGKASFLTALYVLFVPVISTFSGKKVTLRLWIAIAFGILGAYISILGENMSINTAELILLLSALLFSVHIMIISKAVLRVSAVEFSFFQYLFASVISGVFMLFFERPSLSGIREGLIPLFYAGAISLGVGYTLQTIGQKSVEPSKATLILSLESVWAALAGALILHERLRGREIAGCIIIFASVLYASFPEKIRKEA